MSAPSSSASAAGASSSAAAPAASAAADSSAYASAERVCAADAAALVANVNTYLPLAFHYHDEDRVSFYLRRLMQIVGMKADGAVSSAIKRDWIQLLLTQLIAQQDHMHMHVQIKM